MLKLNLNIANLILKTTLSVTVEFWCQTFETISIVWTLARLSMTYRYVLQDVNILSYEKSPVHLFLILAFGIEGLSNSRFSGRTIAPLIVCFDWPAGVLRWGFPLYRTVFIWILIVPYSFHQDSHCTAHFSLGFPLTRTFFIRI